jgi:hypothetical protein
MWSSEQASQCDKINFSNLYYEVNVGTKKKCSFKTNDLLKEMKFVITGKAKR